MSEPVKNAEVEDVLSSIRRLVSEDKRPLQTPKSSPAPTPSIDRLVLTPALRVEEVVEEKADSDAEISAKADVQEAEALDDQSAAESVEKGDVDSADVGDPTHDHSDDYADDPYRFDDTGNLDGEGDEDEISTANADEAVDIKQSLSTDKSVALSAKIAALETAIGDISDEWEPDGTSDDANSGSEPPAMTWEDEDADVEPEMDEDEISDVRFSHRTEAIREAMTEEAADQPDESEAAQEQDDNPIEPAIAEAGETSEAGAAEEADTKELTDAFEFAADDQLLDEETLRDLVSDIVQSELQGALGEKITRNVRRLVRREIHRALTARDLE